MMVIPTKGFHSDTSVSTDLDDLSFDEKRIQIFAKRMLHGRLFIGTFQERRYVDSIDSYRDVVSLSNEEQELIRDVLAVKQRIEPLYSMNHWIGITTPDAVGTPAFYSVWVELPENTLFGKYWFKIRRIRFNANETCLRIKIVRPVEQEIHKSTTDNKEKSFSDNSKLILDDIKEEAKERFIYIFQNITTFKNFKESIIFLFMLLATCFVVLTELLKYLSEYFLKFLREFSNFMKSVAPLFQILANLVERLFKTLCMLIAFLFRGQNVQLQPVHPQINYRGYGYQNIPALPAPPRRHGVIIEEVE